MVETVSAVKIKSQSGIEKAQEPTGSRCDISRKFCATGKLQPKAIRKETQDVLSQLYSECETC